MEFLSGLLIAFAIGGFCRQANIPSPARQTSFGWLLIVAMRVDSLKRDLVDSARILREVAQGFAMGMFHSHPFNHTSTLDYTIDAYEHIAKDGGGRVVLIVTEA